VFGFHSRRLDGRGDIPDGNEFVPKAVNADRGDEVASPAQVAPPDEHPSLGPNLRRSPARYAELEQFFEAGLWKAWLAVVTPSAGLIAAYALVGSRLDASIELCRKLGATPCGASSPQCSISRDHRLLASSRSILPPAPSGTTGSFFSRAQEDVGTIEVAGHSGCDAPAEVRRATNEASSAQSTSDTSA